ncbi:3-hydroxy-3-methylglutaryl coenzyme A synthase [Binucleata daphniae]
MTKSKTGIVGIEYALPNLYVDQKDLAKELNMEEGKLTIGLGLREMGVMSDRDDPISLALTAVHNLLQKYNINTKDVSRIEVGTESNYDSSKSLKTHLLQLFGDNTNIQGVDNTNACYGGTNALLNAIYWMDSSFYDGKYAIVVATDSSCYKEEAAVPTCGAGAVAILLGLNPAFVVNPQIMSNYFANEHDFMKPRDIYPFPIMDAKKSIEVYQTAFASCYLSVKSRFGDDFYKYICMHSPYPKLPEKTVASYNIPKEKLADSLYVSRRNGNSYTSSLYFSLLSLIYNANLKVGDTILMFSFGSGCASTIFCLEKTSNECVVKDLTHRLDQRKQQSALNYLQNNKKEINIQNYVPKDEIPQNDYYLDRIENYKRLYKRNE